jgi:hypothetical protein
MVNAFQADPGNPQNPHQIIGLYAFQGIRKKAFGAVHSG